MSCGDAGGRTKAGAPCSRPAGWGTPRPDGPCKAHRDAVEAARGERPPPSHLSAESAEIWREVTSAYVFGVEGLPILEAALTARDRAADARRSIEEQGTMFVNRKTGMPHRNPMVGVERDALREFRLAWQSLDLDIAPPTEGR